MERSNIRMGSGGQANMMYQDGFGGGGGGDSGSGGNIRPVNQFRPGFGGMGQPYPQSDQRFLYGGGGAPGGPVAPPPNVNVTGMNNYGGGRMVQFGGPDGMNGGYTNNLMQSPEGNGYLGPQMRMGSPMANEYAAQPHNSPRMMPGPPNVMRPPNYHSPGGQMVGSAPR